MIERVNHVIYMVSIFIVTRSVRLFHNGLQHSPHYDNSNKTRYQHILILDKLGLSISSLTSKTDPDSSTWSKRSTNKLTSGSHNGKEPNTVK